MGADSLQAACELAYSVARADVEDDQTAFEPPARMRSFLYVAELPKRAVNVAKRTIEEDSDFRSRVAAEATEESVGRAGYLWLHRPGGWTEELQALTSRKSDRVLRESEAEFDTDTGDVVLDPADFESNDETDLIDPRTSFDFTPPTEEPLVEEPLSESVAAEPDPELEEVYNDLLARPSVELVNAQPPEPTEPDYSFDPGESFSPDSRPIPEASMASVGLIGGTEDADQQPSSFELASRGAGAVTDRANYDVPNEGNFATFGEGDGVIVEATELDFEEDALENELSSLRGLVDRLAGEREMVVSNLPPETAVGAVAEPLVSESVLESEIMALESDLDNVHHELKNAKADLATSRQDREEAQRLQSEALKRQVDLEKELAVIREQRVDIENQASEAQVSVISLEDKIARVQSLLDEADRERNVTKSQLDTMTSERNQLREDRVALKTARDDLQERMNEVEEKSQGADISELVSTNRSMTGEIEATSRELARMIAQSESLEEQISTTTANADELKITNVELTSRLADTDLALETTRTQYEALKDDSDRQAAEVGSLRAERDGLQTQLTELQASLAEVLSEQADTRHRNDTDRQALNELRIERDVLMARMNDLEQADRDYEVRINALVRERDDLMVARDDLVNERGQLRGEASASATEKEQLNERLFDTEARIGPLETELQAERRQREELANRLIELDDIADRNAAELATLTEERGSMSASIEELQQERVQVAQIQAERDEAVAGLQVERDELATQLRSDHDEVAEQLRLTEERLASELAASEQKFAEMSEQLSVIEADRLAIEESAAGSRTLFEGQISDLTSELDSLRYNSSELSSELGRLKQTEEQNTSALAEAQATIESLSSEVQSAREARAEAETQLELSDQARNQLNEQLESQSELAAQRAAELEAAEAKVAEANVAETEARVAAEVSALAAENAVSKSEEDTAALLSLTAAHADAVSAAEAEAEARLAAEAKAEAEAEARGVAEAKAEADARALANADARALAAVEPQAESDSKAEAKAEIGLDDKTQQLEVTAEGAANAEIATEGEDATGPLPEADLELGAETTISAGQTVSIDLAAMAKATEGLVVPGAEKVPEVTTPESEPFTWPAPTPARDGKEDAGSAEVTSLLDKVDEAAPVAHGEIPTLNEEEEEDDLDEVSELIAKTVSSFGDTGEIATPVVDPLDDDFKLELPDTSADSQDLTGRSFPEIATTPPSIFGAKAEADKANKADKADTGDAKESTDSVARRSPSRKRRHIVVPSDIMDDEVAVAQFVVSSPDVVLLVDGDSVAKLGWPSYAVAQQRDALVTYLADLSASSGAAPDVVFDGRIGDDESLPASRAVRIRLSTPPTEPAAALDELVDAYPEQWPIALVTDDPDLAASASERGAAVLDNGQLLDLFISE